MLKFVKYQRESNSQQETAAHLFRPDCVKDRRISNYSRDPSRG